ncbi:HPr family phosphocarrier protein, partial [Gilliamella apis]|uniref:HPr family phosphocarrier protein n=1 Tax=Gilliamella apis TaxID=1970738 RepID=UPI001C2CA43C
IISKIDAKKEQKKLIYDINTCIVLTLYICKDYNMLKEQMVVKNATGLHARPVTTLVKLAGRYKSSIELVYNDKTIKLKSMMGLLGAGVKGGSTVEIICDGEDEQAAMDEIRELFATGFGE